MADGTVENQGGEKVKGVVDIVFLLDVTGSMQACLDGLKRNIETFIDTLTTGDANNCSPVKDWRSRVVGYRDFEVDIEPFVDSPFVRNVDELKSQLNALEAIGGGDEPEGLLDALYKVSEAGETGADDAEEGGKWRYRKSAARVVVIFTDASYKPTMTIPECVGGTFDDVANSLANNRVILSIFAPDMECYDLLAEVDKAEFEALELDPAIDGDSYPRALERYTSNQENFVETLKMLARSISKSSETPAL